MNDNPKAKPQPPDALQTDIYPDLPCYADPSSLSDVTRRGITA